MIPISLIKNKIHNRFVILVIIVSIAGFSQGMLLPLISTIFERDGVPSTLNGFNATALYIGTLIVSPFMEAPLRRFGYKPIILLGGLLVFGALISFAFWKSMTFWFILRMLVGIGDHMLHFSTQTWITSTTHQSRMGRNISIYGLSVGLGFAVGPFFVPLVDIFEGLPFIISSAMCILAWSLVFFLKNDFPEILPGDSNAGNMMNRLKVTILVAWIALLGPFGFGFLESSLNAMYPVSALRSGIPLTAVAFIIPAFSLGGIVSQIPLGILSDRFGRKRVLLIALSGGSVAFVGAAFMGTFTIGVMALFFIAGLFCGSIFSLGVSYMSDLTPRHLLPTGNLLCGIFFSMGSLIGPISGGFFLEMNSGINYLFLISSFLLALFLLSLFGKVKQTRFN